jgi:hypothetical protein
MFSLLLNIINILTLDIDKIKNNKIVRFFSNKYYTYNHPGYTEIELNKCIENTKRIDKSLEHSYYQIDN